MTMVAGTGEIVDTRTDVISVLSAVVATLLAIPAEVAALSRLSDSDLMNAMSAVGEGRDALGAVGAILAGETSRRSAPELGSSGLAQRQGFRTPIEMVKVVTRSTAKDAVTAVQTGTLLVETATEGTADPVTGEVVQVGEPWLSPLAGAVTAGQVSLAAVDAIRAGLGRPDPVASIELLTSAARRLVESAKTMDPDGLRRLARSARDEIDANGIGRREQERRDRRSLRLVTLPDGMGRLTWTMDPETLSSVKDIYDRATSPVLGGVRFVSEVSAEKQQQMIMDARTIEQRASDAFVHLLTAGSDADLSVLLGSGAPVVKFIVSIDDLERRRSQGSTRDARGFIEGQHDPVSIATIERAQEIGTSEPVVFDRSGQLVEASDVVSQFGQDWTGLIDEARGHRLFSRKQKAELAVRDGGCRWPGCNRPPSWCEAHHIEHWVRERGPTVVGNGILLCRHHHLLLHNNQWEIERRSPSSARGVTEVARFWLIPPFDVDPDRTPRPMPSKSAAWNARFANEPHVQ